MLGVRLMRLRRETLPPRPAPADPRWLEFILSFAAALGLAFLFGATLACHNQAAPVEHSHFRYWYSKSGPDCRPFWNKPQRECAERGGWIYNGCTYRCGAPQ